MTLNHINIFLKVYELQNITHAAAALNMTQPAVSRAIKELEQEYDVFLFERLNKRLQITECGKQFYTQALHISHLLDNMDKSLKNWNEQGTIRVGASLTLGNFLLPELSAAFQEQWPDLSIEVRISNGQNLHHDLLANHLDIALIEGYLSDPDLHCEFLSQDKLTLILPNEHPLCDAAEIHLEDLTHHPLLLRETGSVSRVLVDHAFTRAHLNPTPLWRSSSTNALIKAVHCGIGISILPEHLVADEVARGYVSTRTVIDETFLRNNYIVWHKHKLLTPTIKKFINESKLYIEELYPDDMP
ncbi:MAG: LysR family transcriptional regulator [Faecalibacterium sp.]